jgi:hypothetical protein
MVRIELSSMTLVLPRPCTVNYGRRYPMALGIGKLSVLVTHAAVREASCIDTLSIYATSYFFVVD